MTKKYHQPDVPARLTLRPRHIVHLRGRSIQSMIPSAFFPELVLTHLLPLTPFDVRSEIVEVLAGNPVDPNNIIESRTRRKKSVDYVKLNQTVFG